MEFDVLAESWDTQRRIDRAKIIAKQIENSITIEKTDIALEFGCGTGLISLNLKDKFKEIDLVDNSIEMLDKLRIKIAQFQLANFNPIFLDITANQELDKTYDVIYTSMALHHVQDIDSIIKYFYNKLMPGGRLCIVDLSMVSEIFHQQEKDFNGHHGFEQNALKDILSKNEFLNITSNTFYESEKMIDNHCIPYSLFILSANKS